MATSGYSDVYVTKWNTLRFSWSRSSYSIENNTSTISWSLLLISGSYGAISSSASKAWSVNVNGTNYSGNTTIGISNNTTKTLASGSTTIMHNADGTKDFAYSFSQYFGITFSGSSIGTVSGSSSGTLATIPRSASITEAPDFNDETTNLTIKFNNPGNFDLKLKIEAGGDNALIVRDKVTKTSPYTFVLTDAEKKKLRQKCAKNTLNVRFTVATYINGTESEWSWLDRTMTLINYTPTLNPTVVNQYTTLTGDSNKIIRYYNACNAVSNATARKEATIQSIKITCGHNSRTSDGRLNNVDNGTFVFSVTDSRGYTTSKTITKTLIDYAPLTCNFSSNSDLVEGSTANINILVSGTYFSGSFGAVTNSLTVEYRYKTNAGPYGAWTPLTYTISDGKYTAQATIKNIVYTNSYTFQARAKDAIYTSGVTTQEQIVKIAPVFDWGKNDFNFNVPIRIQGHPLADYIIKQGTSGIWTYRKWNSGILECWSCATHTFPTSSMETSIAGIGLTSIDIFLPSEIKFINNPCCTGSSGWYYTEWVQVHCDASKNKISIRCFCNYNSLNYAANKEIPIYCIGRWK